MGFDIHTIDVMNGSQTARQDRVVLGLLPGVVNAAGGGAGQSVTTAVAMPNLPANYTVLVQPGQDATWYITGKTNSGFNVVLNPRLAANTLNAGTFDVMILA